MPGPAPLKGVSTDERIGADYFGRAHGLVPISCLGRLPEVTMPLALVDTAPMGLSLLAAHGKDAFLLRLVEHVASAAD